MQFYHNIITEKSFKYLQSLKKKYDFILIGGWAVFLYSHNLKSKDIDIILDYEELAKFKNDFDIIKNERLKKYEVKMEEIDIDIYVPFYSELGIEVENINDKIIVREGFKMPGLEILFLLKLYAWRSRRGSIKGRKDEIDIFSLAFMPEFDWEKYLKLVKRENLNQRHKEFLSLLKSTVNVKELNINEQKMAKLKKNVLMSLDI